MIKTTYSAGLLGIDGYLVTVECSIHAAKEPHFDLVGLPDNAVREARERVAAAIRNSGFRFPAKRILVNLAPANLKKEGTALDLALAIGLLAAEGPLGDALPSDACFIGELSLSGEVRPANGVLSFALAAHEAGKRQIFVPAENAPEAAIAKGVTVYGVTSLRALVLHLLGKEPIPPTVFDETMLADTRPMPDFAAVAGQAVARRALEIAAAGGHNVLLIGQPGAGKSMLAKRLPSIMPPMTFEEAVEVTRVHSVAGMLGKAGLLNRRPFRAPHHTVSAAGMIGGGTNPRPGEISLADHGILFLDELPEYSPSILETLRQPLEDGTVTVTRVAARAEYPTNFTLVCAMNPCRCGYFGSPDRACTCRPEEVKRYLARISGPLLDRIDIQIEIPPPTFGDLTKRLEGEDSATIRRRVIAAREFSRKRSSRPNARLSPEELSLHCTPDEAGLSLLRAAFDKLGLSARGHDKILRIARTIADLAGEETVGAMHVAEAIGYRSLDRKYWGR